MTLFDLHGLTACLLFPLTLALGAWALWEHRRKRGIRLPLQAAAILVQAAVLLQIYLGIALLDERRRRSLLHYSLGLLVLAPFFLVYWLHPQLRHRPALALGLASLTALAGVALAFFIG